VRSLVTFFFIPIFAILLLTFGCGRDRPEARYLGYLRDVLSILSKHDPDVDSEALLDGLEQFWNDNQNRLKYTKKQLGTLSPERSVTLYRRAEKLFARVHRRVQASPELIKSPLVQMIMRQLAP
jgi:hypothetical protein